MEKRVFIKHVRNWNVPQVTKALAAEPELASYVDQRGKTPLQHCAGVNLNKSNSQDSVKTARALVKAGADVNAIRVIIDEGEEFHATALWYAVAWGKNFDLARFLLTQGASPINCMWAACWDQDQKMAGLLRSFGAEVDPVFHDETPLLQIVKAKRLKLLGWLVEQGAHINFQDKAGYSALHYAIKRNHNLQQIEELLRLGADPMLRADNGVTPLSMAMRLKKPGLVSLLESFCRPGAR